MHIRFSKHLQIYAVLSENDRLDNAVTLKQYRFLKSL